MDVSLDSFELDDCKIARPARPRNMTAPEKASDALSLTLSDYYDALRFGSMSQRVRRYTSRFVLQYWNTCSRLVDSPSFWTPSLFVLSHDDVPRAIDPSKRQRSTRQR
jgi:hypothetical protein